jgi:quercetin dioxygenase-like cupin family protein
MRVVWMPGGVRTAIHLTGEDTDGAFCMLVDLPPEGWGLPPHRHLNEAETIHIVEGEFEMEVDGRPLRLAAGESVHIPRGVVHAGRGAGRRLVLFSPAGMERFFLEVGGDSPDAVSDLDVVLDSAGRYGWEFA